MDAERWQRLSPLLDALFELEPDERARRLALMRAEDPAQADELQALVALEEASGDFLSEPLVAPLPGARVGALIGPYRLERMLGEGGMGQVWLASRADGMYHRRVALKLLRPGLVDPGLRLRFQREREILARLAHPHIARLLYAGLSDDSQPFLVLEYIEGEPVTDWCEARDVPIAARLELFGQVCQAVSHAHANLIVHRDLKPSNILVTATGAVQLLDFGIAKLLDTSEGTAPEYTGTGMRAFTLHYAAPEQIRGELVTTMTDVYALGVVLYELLAGAKPYTPARGSDAAWEEAILSTDPLPPSQALQRAVEANPNRSGALRRRARQVAGDLDNIVLKALAKEPVQRYPSVEALSRDVQRYLEGQPVLAKPRGVAYKFQKFVARHRWPLASASLVGLAVAAALVVVLWQARLALQDASRAQAMQSFVIGLFEQAGAAPPDASLELRRLLAAGVERGNRELSGQPLARAELLGLGARLRLGLGDHREAAALLDRQADILAALGDTVPTGLRLEAATLRGRSLFLGNAVAGCIDAMEPWLPIVRREQARLPAQAAAFQSQLARCRRANGEPRLARLLLEDALDVHAGLLRDEVGVVERLRELAQLHVDAGETTAALRVQSDALARLRQEAGTQHPLVIELLGDIGASREQLGQPAAAERAHAEALVLALEVLGPRHPATVRARQRLEGAREARQSPSAPASGSG
ncbi:MAG TPA: serine/threonine-protein kinase [Xanthomonadaceae bacterium]|nr:serine/threonine-protein kinase [Xanthomonadaceae bacterium]